MFGRFVDRYSFGSYHRVVMAWVVHHCRAFNARLICLMIFCAGTLTEQSLNARANSLVQLPGCEFLVTFPEPPQIRKFRGEWGDRLIEYQQASLVTPDEYLRAECLPFPIDQLAAIQTLQNQAQADGLQNSSTEELSSTIVKLRGYKNVQGRWATFTVEIHRGKVSALIMAVGASSSKFPTTGISNFTSSIRAAN